MAYPVDPQPQTPMGSRLRTVIPIVHTPYSYYEGFKKKR